MIRTYENRSDFWNLPFAFLVLCCGAGILTAAQTPDKAKRPVVKKAASSFDADDPSGEFSANRPIEPGKYTRDEAVEIAKKVVEKMTEVNRCWIFAPKMEAREWSYTFRAQLESGEKMEKKQTLDRKGSAPWERIRGITYFGIAQSIASAEENEIRYKTVTVTENEIKILFSSSGKLSQRIGNGMDGQWFGYFTSKVSEGMLYVDPKDYTVIGVKMPKGAFEKYTDYVDVDKTMKVPQRIEIANGPMRFDMKFKAYEPGLWLLDRSEYTYNGKKTSVATLTEIEINGKEPKEIGPKE